MMLPQETIDKIKADADKYGFVVPYNGSKSFYLEDKVKGYQAGATEWAGKAKPVVDALDQIKNWSGGTEDAAYRMKVIASDALEKYREVGNG
jgi:hypothetical protein